MRNSQINSLLFQSIKNSKTKIKVRNNNCGHEYSIKQQDLLSGKDCLSVTVLRNIPKKKFEDIFKQKGLKGFSVVGTYTGINNDVEIIHDECGTKFNIKPSAYFKQFKKCPHCFTKSLGEERVASILDNKNIKYIREYRFNDCRYKHTLPFDFYIKELNICIEYQGKQHYSPVSEFGGNERYEYTKRNDLIKKRVFVSTWN